MAITLNQNEIVSSLSNMIISAQSFGFKPKGDMFKFVERASVDGSLYGDTKLYRSADVIHSKAWANDAEASNLLQTHRQTFKEQKITLNQFRQAVITTDNVLSKRAYLNEGEFGEAIGILNANLTNCKKIHNATTYNAFIGTAKSSEQGTSGVVTLDISTDIAGLSGEELNRVSGQALSQKFADLLDDITDLSTDYNDYGQYRTYDKSDLVVVWNKKAINKITKLDLPTIYHDSKVFDGFADTMKDRFFGDINVAATLGDGETVRSLIEQKITGSDSKTYEVFAGDLIPTVCTAPAGTSYTVNTAIIAKIMHKDSVPFMSAFSIGSNFFNAASLTENKYLTWGYNELDYLKEYPFIEVQVKTEADAEPETPGE